MPYQAATQAPITRTKLHRPPVPRDLVRRPRLHEALDRFRSLPVTLVSAAAGYGKSTLVSAWLTGLEDHSAWVSLDERDDSLREILRYLVAAVQSEFPTALQETQALCEVNTMPPPSMVATTLLNELDELDEPLILVLDDIHNLKNRAVTDLLSELLSHPPAGLHLVLLGRRDPFLPIAKLRAQGLLGEFRSEDLIFTAAETRSFLENVLATEVDADTASTWAKGAEGWVTGLRLAALAQMPGRHELGDPFGRWKGRRHALQYLLNEVVNRQTRPVAHHLLRSAIADRFCAPLCDALREAEGEEDADGMAGNEFLEWLEDTGLFVVPLDREHRWFRYHHLFRDMLLKEATRLYGVEQFAALHLAAGEWFGNDGEVDEALDHFLAAGEAERAADRVEALTKDTFHADRWYVLDKRLARLPDAVVQRRPILLMARAWVLYFHGKHAEFLGVLDSVEPLLTASVEHRGLCGEMAFFRGVVCFYEGAAARSLELFEEALAAIPVSNPVRRGEVDTYVGLATQLVIGSDRAKQRLDELLGSDPPLEARRRAPIEGTSCIVALISGDLDRATFFAHRIEESAIECQSSFMKAWAEYLQGSVHLLRYQLDDVVEHLSRAVDHRFFFDARAGADAYAGLVAVLQALGRNEAARATMDGLREFAAVMESEEVSGIADAVEARLAIETGQPETAAALIPETDSPGPEVMLHWLEIPSITACRALVAEGSPASLRRGLERLSVLEEGNEAQHNTFQRIRIWTLQAAAYGKLDRPDDAYAVLERALAHAEPGGLILPFVESGPLTTDLLRRMGDSGTTQTGFIKRILATHYELGNREDGAGADGSAPASPNGATDALTPREVEVLVLLADGLYQKEIAERLLVSVETVKTHLKHIYQKLGVRNRMGAVESARANSLTATR